MQWHTVLGSAEAEAGRVSVILIGRARRPESPFSHPETPMRNETSWRRVVGAKGRDIRGYGSGSYLDGRRNECAGWERKRGGRWGPRRACPRGGSNRVRAVVRAVPRP